MQQFFSSWATFPCTTSCKIHFTAQCNVPLLLYRVKTDTDTHFPLRYKHFSASGMCWGAEREAQSPKSAPSIPEKLMGYLCNKPAHPSQVYATLHSLYLPWSAGLCKLGKQAQSDSFPSSTGRNPLKEFQAGIRRLGKAGRKKNQEFSARRKNSQSSIKRRSWGRQKIPGHR